MVCPRCIAAVESVLQEIDIPYNSIKLGEVELKTDLPDAKRKMLADKLNILGFELLESDRSKTISQIKGLIINQIHHKKEKLKVNLSTFLADNLHQDYSSLSRLFSSVEGITIEKFAMRQKIERVKELLFYDEHNLSEIAYEMEYSSVAHLSTQFKKETGMTPTEFKRNKSAVRSSIDGLD
ncbi:helix-turn-helix transcriptional regulator [Cryomorpha ignava]|uniref:Helix-turn-helix transcriptional regulator n=2 Tax=Cryomorpha ignava TaxID=101383 RepID=A0A7K3WT98_9FLAO|nr:helix-turn-helix transcriptional regulator [Cryomorpha ignava]